MIETLKVPPPEMFDAYDTGTKWTPPPQAKALNEQGKLQYIQYQATMPSADKYSFQPDKNGFLMLVVEGIELPGPYVLKKTYLSSAPFPKKDKAGNVVGTRNASSLGNFFRAFAMSVRPSSAAEYEALAMATAGLQCEVTIDWEAYDADAGITAITSWDHFPDDPDRPGCKLAYVEKGDKRLWARASIKRFIDAL